jgi:hypothetical protein
MAIVYPETPCSVCGQAIGTDKSNILGFDFIEIPHRDFQHFADGLAHVSCLSSWNRRDEFIPAWNRALSEYYTGKQLFIDADGRVTYTNHEAWRIQHSQAVRRRHAEEWAQLEEQFGRRRESLARRMEALREKAIRLGLASPADVDRIIYNLPADEFRRHFSEFYVSRAFFKRAL